MIHVSKQASAAAQFCFSISSS